MAGPEPVEPKVQVSLPSGMSETEFLKLFGTFQKQRIDTARRDKATRSALNLLKDAHKDEYDKIYGVEIAKQG